MGPTKYIFVTGGVTSSLGKGIVSASLGKLLRARGLSVTIQKFDPYINVDPGSKDSIGDDEGADVILGDHGQALFETGSGLSVLTHVETGDPEYGNGDFIFSGNGPDVVLGGSSNAGHQRHA